MKQHINSNQVLDVLKIFILIFGLLPCLAGCVTPSDPYLATQGFIPQRLSPYVLWQTVRGSASMSGLSQPTVLHVATVAQNLFTTGQRGQIVTWADTNTQIHGEITLIDILPQSSVPCLRYSQKIVLPQETREAQGIACMGVADVWQIVEENPVNLSKPRF